MEETEIIVGTLIMRDVFIFLSKIIVNETI